MVQLIKKFRNAKLATQGIIAAISLGLYFLTSFLLEQSYALSKFPVSYFEAQTSFDAVKMKEWYAYMIQENTFDIYFKTQLIDFAFIAAVILAGFTLWTFIANLHHKNSFFQKIGYKLAFALPLAGAFDILENLVSFFMLANPSNFSEILVIPYSTFAVIKFGFWTIALLWIVIALIALPITKIINRKKIILASLMRLVITSITFAQNQETSKSKKGLIYIEADPFAYINNGYSIHLGYENWGMRFDLTKVKVDFPETFEDAFYGTQAFDLVTHIHGIKIDYIGKRKNWTKGAFIGLDINQQRLNFTHRETAKVANLNTFNIGLRAGYKFNIFRGFYLTPWAAVWKNVAGEKSFEVGTDKISTNGWDWITTLHFGYAISF